MFQQVDFKAAVVITLRWPDLLATVSAKGLPLQYIETENSYVIFALDSQIVYTSTLIKLDASEAYPFENYSPDYDRTQNDADVTGFEATYKSTANSALTYRASTGVEGSAPAKGLGGFVPDPTNNPYAPGVDEVVGHYVDSEGSLVTRGKIFTDEGSFRDDFTGNDLAPNLTGTVSFTAGSTVVTGVGTQFTSELDRDDYIKLVADGVEAWSRIVRVPSDTECEITDPYAGTTDAGAAQQTRWVEINEGGTPGTASVESSTATLSSGTGTDGTILIHREADYAPVTLTLTGSVSQRIANQTVFFGFRDDPEDPEHYCDVQMTGTDATRITFRSAFAGDEQSTTVTLPVGLSTTAILRYKIDLNIESCALLVNGVLLARHDNHVPDPYITMEVVAGIVNSGAVTNTELIIDTVLFVSHNQVQLGALYEAPMPIIVREDQHTVTGKLVTSSASSDQVILSYDVPAGKVFYLIGYRVSCEGTLTASPLKIGRTPLGDEPSSPGSVDGNIFRAFNLAAGGSTGEIDFGSNPRKVGVGGDTIVIAVTPSGLLSCTWHASLDFVLR